MKRSELSLVRTKAEIGMRLLDALRLLPALREDMRNPRPADGYDNKVLSIDVFHGCEAGGETSCGIEIDLVTGRELLADLESLIERRLTELGIEAD